MKETKIVKKFSEIEHEDIDYLWEPYISTGNLTLIVGDPGCGKSTLSTYIASILSKGNKFPLQENNIEVGNTLILNVEDSVSIVKDRLVNHKADLDNVLVINEENIVCVEDVKLFEEVLEYNNIKLMIFDPLNSYLGKNVNINNDKEVRRTLMPLLKLSRKYKFAIIGIMHFNKSEDKNESYRMLGSIGFRGLARSVIYITTNDKEEVVMIHSKCNYSSKGKTLNFKISEEGINWIGIDEILTATNVFESEKDSKLKQAKYFIIGCLSSTKKVLPSDLEKYSQDCDIKPRTFERARGQLRNEHIIDINKNQIPNYWYLVKKEKNSK